VTSQSNREDSPHLPFWWALRIAEHAQHYCGIFGVYGHPQRHELMTYYGMYALQHRGQGNWHCGPTVKQFRVTSWDGAGLKSLMEVLHDLVGNIGMG